MLRFVAVGRLGRDPATGAFSPEQHQIVAMASAEKQTKAYKSHVKDIMARGATKLQPGVRLKLASDDGTYDVHVMPQELDLETPQPVIVVFFAIADPQFSVNYSISKMFSDFVDRFMESCDAQSINSASSSSGPVAQKSQSLLNDLLNRHERSRLRDVNQKVDVVKGVMRDNLDKAMVNMARLDDMDEKSSQLEESGKLFSKNANKLKSMMRWRYIKQLLLIAVVVIVVIVIIVLSSKKT